MTIKTNFNEGDKVFTIDTNTIKVKEFEVGRISTCTCNGKTSVTLYPKGENYSSTGYNEDKCFSTQAELITFVTTKDDAKTL